MKKVAFLSFDWDYEIMSLYYKGMRDCLEEYGSAQLIVFNAFGEYESHETEEGAVQIFSLCDYQDYDGFIIQGNRAWPPSMRKKCAEAICALHKPLVSISYDLPGARYVGTNNYEAMYGMVAHIITEWGCSKPAFVNGLSTSLEAQDRACGFLDACANLGIVDARFYEGNWHMDAGKKAALQMLERPDDLPDVVFCCNDNLALGVQLTLQEHGVRIPDDVRVTGFDNREIAISATPRITTIDRDYATVGYTALETVMRLMRGDDVPAKVSSPVRYVLTESCGYPIDGESESAALRRMQATHLALTHFYRMLRRFQPAVLDAESVEEILMVCDKYLYELECPNVYLAMNDDYFEFDSSRTATSYGTSSTLKVHCSTTSSLTHDKEHGYMRFLSKQILPPEVHMNCPLYVVYPLRHHATCIGTLVTEGLSPLMEYGFLVIILKLISCSIENMRKKELLQNLNMRLDNLYVHDQLTGLFNRFGLYRFGRIAYEHLLRDFEEAQFIFVDIDRMKVINDVYGHEAGDLALKDVADVINRAIRGENAFAMRYGGDEFLLICRRNLIPKLKQELELLKSSSTRPYDLSLSMGLFRVRVGDKYTMEQAIEAADEKMYEIKKARKAERE
ncbi:MAG: GGDEF domain-containing protein [Atopobiaceae bacterium]|nr:GGDEF domain-containing protein [Atopobiaceae bacterium]